MPANIRQPTAAPPWLRDYTRGTEREIDRAAVMSAYTVATAPSAASNPYRWIFVTDEAGGAVPAFSDGTNWRRVTDRAIIS
jgi:hypothetical protein